MKKNIITLCFFVITLFVITSCKKTPAGPPVKDPGQVLTVADLKAIASCTNNCQKTFTSNIYVSGIILADAVSGNFYKETFIRDATGALHLTFKAGIEETFIGDSVRLNLNGYSIAYAATTSMLEVDSISQDSSFVKLGKGTMPKPRVLNINQISTSGYYNSFLNDLVIIDGIGFARTDTGQLYVNINSSTQNRNLLTCTNDAIVLRTSSYANFGTQKTPAGYGHIIGIATAYGSTKQLMIRNTTEWSMTSTTCITPPTPGLYLQKTFNDNSVTSGGWTMQNVTGAVNYTISTAGSWADKPYASISGYYSLANHLSETWLISPPVDLSSSNNPVLSFANAYNYTGPALQVLISTNYSSGLPSTATWTPLTYTASPGGFTYISSGNILLNTYKTNNVRIGFKYTSTASNGSTWEVDDIQIIEN